MESLFGPVVELDVVPLVLVSGVVNGGRSHVDHSGGCGFGLRPLVSQRFLLDVVGVGPEIHVVFPAFDRHEVGRIVPVTLLEIWMIHEDSKGSLRDLATS